MKSKHGIIVADDQFFIFIDMINVNFNTDDFISKSMF
jgi:hypothetical protein